MKAILFLMLCIANSALVFSQPYLKFTGTNRGLEISIGAMTSDGGLDFNVAYKSSLSRNDKPKVLSASIGKQLLLTNKEEDNYSITPSLGYGYLAWKDYSKYSSPLPSLPPILPGTPPTPSAGPLPIHYDNVQAMQTFKPLVGLELAKDSYMGRYGLTAAWCGDFYFGVTLRMFPYRNRRA